MSAAFLKGVSAKSDQAICFWFNSGADTLTAIRSNDFDCRLIDMRPQPLLGFPDEPGICLHPIGVGNLTPHVRADFADPDNFEFDLDDFDGLVDQPLKHARQCDAVFGAAALGELVVAVDLAWPSGHRRRKGDRIV